MVEDFIKPEEKAPENYSQTNIKKTYRYGGFNAVIWLHQMKAGKPKFILETQYGFYASNNFKALSDMAKQLKKRQNQINGLLS